MANIRDICHTRTFPLQVNQCRLDPAVCETLLALPLTKTTIGLCDLTDPKAEPVSLVGHKRSVTALAFSHDEPRLLCSAGEDYVIVWNVRKCMQNAANGSEVRGEVILSHPGDVSNVCFSIDAARVALCTDSVVKIVDVSKTKVVAELVGHDARVTAAEFCPHFSATLVTISDDRTVIVWDVQDYSLVYQSAILSAAPLISLCMDQTGARVAVASAGGTIKVFDLEDGKNFRQLCQLEVGKMLTKFRQARELGRSPAPSDGPVVVTKGGTMRKGEGQAMAGASAGDGSFSSIESSDPVLSLMYTYSPDTSSSSAPARGHGGGRFGSSAKSHGAVRQVLAADSPVLVVVSSHCMIQIDSKTLHVLSLVDFQEPVPSWFQSGMKELTIGAVGLAGLGQLAQGQLVAVVGTQFECRVHSLQWELASSKNLTSDLNGSMDKLAVSPSGQEGFLSAQSANELSMVAINPLTEKSPLKSELIPNTPGASAQGGSQANRRSSLGGKGPGNKPDPMNQPLTFKPKVKSSGYTQAPRTTMFKPKTKIQSKLVDTSKTGKGQSLAAKISSQEYPHDAGPPTSLDCKLSTGAVPTSVTSLRFSGTGQHLACSLSNKTSLVFPAPLGQKDSSVLVGHDSLINSVHWSNSGKYLLTASNDKSAVFWDRASAESLLAFNSMDNNFKESGGGGGDKAKKKDDYTKEVKGAQFYYMDKFVLIIMGNKLCLYKYHLDPTKDDIRRYLTKSKYKLVKTWETCSQNFTALAAINAFFSHLAVCSASNRDLEIFDLNEGRQVHIFTDAHSKPAHAVALNEGSTFTSQPQESLNVFATSANLDCIKLWDVRSKRCVLRLQGHSSQAHSCGIAFSACGTYLASGSEDKLAYVYDIRQGTFCQKLRGHTDVVSSVAFHPAKPLLATGATDGKLLLFKA